MASVRVSINPNKICLCILLLFLCEQSEQVTAKLFHNPLQVERELPLAHQSKTIPHGLLSNVLEHRKAYRLDGPNMVSTMRKVQDTNTENESNITSLTFFLGERVLNPSDTSETAASFRRIINVMNLKEQSARLKMPVRIGRSMFKPDRITPVGDIDDNGIVDYVVSNPTANDYHGSIRLYLMDKGDRFLYTRELVPGEWGFDSSPLDPCARYGFVVKSLPITPNSGQ